MAKRSRLDAELVRRGHARSRGHAAEIIESGFVRVAGMVASKAATQIGTDQPIVVRTPSEEPTYVSRGAHKLVGALDAFGLAVRGRRALDAGASTGVSPTCCCVVARRTSRRSTSGTGSSPGRCAVTSACG